MIGYGNSMFLSTHGILSRSSSGNLLLDSYPNAAVAYSLRKLRSAYTGSAIRVRRSSDNAEQDIAFVGNDLDTQTMLDFVGDNMWTYSEEFDNLAYTKTALNTTGTPAYIDVETAPDGTLTGDKIIENTSNAVHAGARASGTIINGTSYNISVYLKQGERTKVQVASGISGSTQTCDVDLTNGNISNNGFANTPVVTSEANGWYRFSVTITSGVTTTTAGISIRLMSGANTSYTGNGTSGAYVWGFQLSQTSSVKTYQKTVATVAGNGFIATWYDQSENANNSTQATAANQAQIVSSGSLISDPNTGKISVTWTADSYSISNVAVTQNMLVSGVINRTATLTRLLLLGHTATSPRLIGVSNNGDIISQIGTGSVTHTNITTGAFIISGLRDSSNVVKAWTNTTALTTGTSTGTTGNFTRFGIQDLTATSGRIVEMVYWNNDKESSRANIVTNQNTYWNVY